MAIISTTDISKSYRDLKVLQNIDISIDKSEIVAITGKSGAGKSTLLHILGTLDSPDSGSVIINDTDPFQLKGKDLGIFRNRHIGFVFQFHHLLVEFTALENILIPAKIAGANNSIAEKKAYELLDILGMMERKNHKPGQLSGGEQQRIAMARALINEPDIVLADEPSGNLDNATSEDLHNLIFQLREELGQTFVIVTHNNKLADLSDRIIKLSDGHIVS